MKCSLTRLAKYDVVLTTYNIVGKEVGAPEGDKNGEEPVKDDETEEKVTRPFLQGGGRGVAIRGITPNKGISPMKKVSSVIIVIVLGQNTAHLNRLDKGI